jgi:hypothetical protein
MKFGLFDGDMNVMTIYANSERGAIDKVRNAGIKNRSNIFKIMKMEDE